MPMAITPVHQQQERDQDSAGARSPPPPLESNANGTANDDDDAYVTLFERDGFEGDTALAEPDRDTIEPLVRELVTPGNPSGDWAEEMEGVYSTVQGMHDRFRATNRVAPTVPPQYIPPALRHDTGTPHRSFQQNPWSQNFRRDPPPHKYTPTHSPRPSDSPNWRAPSPNRPASSRSPLPSPQPPPTPPISPLCPDIPLMPLKNLTRSQLTSNLVSLIKTTLEVL
jgi:hypothetical protein